MLRQRKPPSQTWRIFLENHVKQLVSTDFLVVPTVSFRVLYVFVVLAHHRRHAIHFNVTAHPPAEWTARQIAEAFPWDSAPRYLLHDRDGIYGAVFRQRVGEMGIREVMTAPRCPWQNPYAERFIGSLRRECLDHVIVLDEASLRRIIRSYFQYLRALTDTSGARERRARIQSHSTSRTRYGRRAAAGGWAASSLRAKSCLRG